MILNLYLNSFIKHFLPFGLQTTQIHLNYWSEKDFNNFSKLIKKHSNKVVSYDEALRLTSDNLRDKIFNFFIKKFLSLKE